MKIRLKTPKPRNPFVAPSLMRSAGGHRRSAGSLRQQARQSLRRELGRDPDRPSP